MREIIKTEDPNGSVITVDTPDEPCGTPEGDKKIRLWSADFHFLASWCFECKRFHKANQHG